MFTNVTFYAANRGFAPREWKINSRPYTNRLYYIYGGSAWFLGEAGDHRLKTDHLYFFPHSLEFRVRQDAADPLDHLYFDFAVTPPFTGRQLVELSAIEDSPIRHTAAALSALFRSADSGDPNGNRLIRYYFECLLLLLSKERSLPQLSDTRLMAVADYIHLHYAEAVSTRYLASMTNMEENHFIRTFKKAMGVTPYQYLREYRLNTAAALLEQGSTVVEAARLVGYENTASLSNAMKKNRGYYPSVLIPK